jgi:DNA helicase-2/ATP-dependent DNA helicase PcrA
MTRARRKLYLTWTPFRRNFGPDAGMPSLPSRFLKEVPDDLVEGLETQAGSVFEEDGDYQDWEEDEDEDDAEEEAAEVNGGSVPKSIAELRAYVQKQKAAAQKQISVKPGAGGTGKSLLMAGMRVRHPQFGDGIILNRERVGNDVKLTITFSRVGRKTLMERYAKLQAL